MQLKKIMGLFLSTTSLACIVGCSSPEFNGEVTREFITKGYSKEPYNVYEVVDNNYNATLVGIPVASNVDPYNIGDNARGITADKIVGKASTTEYSGHAYLNGKLIERANGGYVHLIEEYVIE